jgi:hypothetical protein
VEKPVPVGQEKFAKPNNKTNKQNGNKNREINVGCWNIRRGLLIREQELREIIRVGSLDLVFLTETDTTAVNNENDYVLSGFKTIIQKKTIPRHPPE